MKDSMRGQLRDLQKNVEILGNAMDRVIGELQNTTTLSFGTHKVVKELPGYAEALIKVQEEFNKKNEELDGQEQGDTK